MLDWDVLLSDDGDRAGGSEARLQLLCRSTMVTSLWRHRTPLHTWERRRASGRNKDRDSLEWGGARAEGKGGEGGRDKNKDKTAVPTLMYRDLTAKESVCINLKGRGSGGEGARLGEEGGAA